MQLRSLTIQAIGPFKDAFTIDFARLAEGGLFLLEGPTGAGKSTIIDAIVFALYGKVASAGASDDRLRSTHVGPEVESFVDLVLEVPAGVYRVRRSPRTTAQAARHRHHAPADQGQPVAALCGGRRRARHEQGPWRPGARPAPQQPR